jgi:hypothetical protein
MPLPNARAGQGWDDDRRSMANVTRPMRPLGYELRARDFRVFAELSTAAEI